jgi:hypothetical protein
VGTLLLKVDTICWPAFRLIEAANMLIKCKLLSIALRLSKTQDQKSLTLHWRSIDDLLMLGWRSVQDIATMLLKIFLPRKAADCMSMDICGRTAPWCSTMQGLKLLTHERHSFLGHSYNVLDTILTRKAAGSSIMNSCPCTAPQLCKMHGLKSLILRECSVDCHFRTFSDIVAYIFLYKAGQ